MTRYRIAFHTLGCKTNHYETDAIAGQFRLHGFEQVEFQDEADVYLRRAGQRNPDALIVAMGCHAELSDTSSYADLCIGTQGKSQAVSLVSSALKARADESGASLQMVVSADAELSKGKRTYEALTDYEELGLSDQQSETRAYLKIEDGCNAFCSYCAIPLARGRVRSREEAQILQEADALVRAGYREIVLTGIHLCSYGSDRGLPDHAVADLAVKIAEVTAIDRVRLGSLEPLYVTGKFLEILASNSKICPHFHLSLQSGSDHTLSAMNRRYNSEQFRKAVNRIREIWPKAGITTDIIVGFPGETDLHFSQSLEFCREMKFSRMHIFRFSARAGTRAAEMKNQVEPAVAAKRSQVMQELAVQMAAEFHAGLVGDREIILTEKIFTNNSADGYTASYVPVIIESSAQLSANQLINAEIVASNAEYVTAIAVKQV
jgi:threonylcarbamoyladenosine tRNA methylthiotransferase MtaB